MTNLDIRIIITKYLNQEATPEEISLLFEWIKKEGNQEVFKKLVQADFLIGYENKSWDSEAAFKHFLQNTIGKRKIKVRPIFGTVKVLKYAATILILITATTFLILNAEDEATMRPYLNPDEITLQLDNGEIINLGHENDTIIKVNQGMASIHLSNGVLRQNKEKQIGSSSGYNILRIPYGKILSVTLDDGSIIKLNSGSELRYPSSFEGLEKRQVFLRGEAFFEIAKNPAKPFLVQTDEMYTQVFGTVFNLSAYDDDETAEVVLVEGSVGVGHKSGHENDKLKMLKPSQKATNSKVLEKSLVIEDVDVTPYISWTKGIVAFENEQMSEILKKLERQFNVEIFNENDMLGELRFTGMFDGEGIDLILKTIQTHTNFSYTKKGNIITIKNPESL